MSNENLVMRAVYWKEVQNFTQSVISGLIWYIKVSLLHGGIIPDVTIPGTSDFMKVPQALLPYLFSEASRIFSIYYQEKNLYKFILLDCQTNPHFNGCRGHVTSFNQQCGQYTISLDTSTQVCSATASSFIVMKSYPHYMEPMVKFKKFGIKKFNSMKCNEIVSLPNHLYPSVTSSPLLQIKFYPRIFELMRKKYIRPETTPNFISIKDLRAELTKMNEESSVKIDQRMKNIRMEYTAYQNKIYSFIFPFQVNDRSLFQSGQNLSYFTLDINMENMDDVLDTLFRQEGSIKLHKSSFNTLIPGHLLDSNIIDLCLKW
jgi:hypothetical protein